MLVYSLLLTATVAVALQTSPKPGMSAENRALSEQGYKSLHGKHSPIADQLTAFNSLEYHAHNRFFAKTMSYNDVVSAATDVGPFNVSLRCTDAKVEAFIGVTNTFSYPITFHGNFLSGADSSAVSLLNAGEGANLLVATWTDSSSTGNQVGAPASKGAVLLSNGYFLSLSNADSTLMTVSNDDTDDRMPNSDCTVAGFLDFAHPKHGQYYDGFLYEDVLLQQASGLSPSSSALAGGVFLGVLVGAAVVVLTTLVVAKNRSLLLHAVGYYDSAAQCVTPMEDSSTTGLTGASASASDSTA